MADQWFSYGPGRFSGANENLKGVRHTASEALWRTVRDGASPLPRAYAAPSHKLPRGGGIYVI